MGEPDGGSRMAKVVALGVVLLGSVALLAQGPPLSIFVSPDRTFQFAYPETYELLVGERMSKATQGRGLSLPVCDILTALACVIYPLDRLAGNFEGAGFSVSKIAGATTETDCVTYRDLKARPRNTRLAIKATSINGREFQMFSSSVRQAGHYQDVQLYRTFHNNRCYELRTTVSMADTPTDTPAMAETPAEANVNRIRDHLSLILNSFSLLN